MSLFTSSFAVKPRHYVAKRHASSPPTLQIQFFIRARMLTYVKQLLLLLLFPPPSRVPFPLCLFSRKNRTKLARTIFLIPINCFFFSVFASNERRGLNLSSRATTGNNYLIDRSLARTSIRRRLIAYCRFSDAIAQEKRESRPRSLRENPGSSVFPLKLREEKWGRKCEIVVETIIIIIIIERKT